MSRTEEEAVSTVPGKAIVSNDARPLPLGYLCQVHTGGKVYGAKVITSGTTLR